MMTTFVGEPISPAELASIIEKFQPKTETKSMKPKVQWICLKTDAPAPGRRYWFAAPGGPSTAMWLNATPEFNDLTSGTLAKILDSGFTHWAPYEAPEPPPKPTPFEVWWNGLPRAKYFGDDFRNVGSAAGNYAIHKEMANSVFLAGYEACAKNMVGGGK